jgi:hypothetical protein
MGLTRFGAKRHGRGYTRTAIAALPLAALSRIRRRDEEKGPEPSVGRQRSKHRIAPNVKLEVKVARRLILAEHIESVTGVAECNVRLRELDDGVQRQWPI